MRLLPHLWKFVKTFNIVLYKTFFCPQSDNGNSPKEDRQPDSCTDREWSRPAAPDHVCGGWRSWKRPGNIPVKLFYFVILVACMQYKHDIMSHII